MTEQKEHRILSGMNLIAKYEPDADLSAEHDIIWFGHYQPDLMTEEEREQMKRWGWHEDMESWSHSC
jgi:hypothetical protein